MCTPLMGVWKDKDQVTHCGRGNWWTQGLSQYQSGAQEVSQGLEERLQGMEAEISSLKEVAQGSVNQADLEGITCVICSLVFHVSSLSISECVCVFSLCICLDVCACVSVFGCLSASVLMVRTSVHMYVCMCVKWYWGEPGQGFFALLDPHTFLTCLLSILTTCMGVSMLASLFHC